MSVTDAPGYVYLIRMGGTDMYKVGYTSKTPEERRASLQTGNPYPLDVVTSWIGSVEDERRLHALLDTCRREGEWFELTVANLLSLLCQYEALPPAPAHATVLDDTALKSQIKADIFEFYLDFGPQDDGKVQVSDYLMELIRMDIIQCRLWKWYSEDEIQAILSFDAGEAYQGEDCFDVCVQEGYVQQVGDTFRIDPELTQAGYEYFLEFTNLYGE